MKSNIKSPSGGRCTPVKTTTRLQEVVPEMQLYSTHYTEDILLTNKQWTELVVVFQDFMETGQLYDDSPSDRQTAAE